MIRHLIRAKTESGRGRIFRQHSRLPVLVILHEPAVNIRLPFFEIRPLQRIGYNIEQKSILVDLQPLHIAIAHGPLRFIAEAPEELAGNRRSVLREGRQEVHPVRRISRIGLCAGGGEKGGHPVH